MTSYFDVVVVGGSVSGLLAARELAQNGINVCILEEDYEIGTPEHCGGVVSLEGIKDLGILPSNNIIQNEINTAKISSPDSSFTISAKQQKVVVIDRRAFDKLLAYDAQKNGAEIRTRFQVTSIKDIQDQDSSRPQDNFTVNTKNESINCRYVVDARGVSSIIHTNRNGILSSAQYEVYFQDGIFEHDKIHVVFDNMLYPGFFAWIIPIDHCRAKIGVAGKNINSAVTLSGFLDSLGAKRYSTIRKIYAPIWVGGPLDNFVDGNKVIVGDAAGQTKPTTAGGIYSCGCGGIIAGKTISKAINENDKNVLSEYNKAWSLRFRKEFEKMLYLRKILERLDNKSLNEIFSTVSNSDLSEISKTGDFDFHSIAVSKILGSKGIFKILNSFLGNEVRRLFS